MKPKRKSRRLPHTPTSQIRSALRKLWLRSRERVAALKRDGYSCQCCGVKQSKAKGREVAVEVHHTRGVRWDEIFRTIRAELLADPVLLQTVCVECHKKLETETNQ